MLGIGDARYVVYVLGLPPAPAAGGPWRITAGVGRPRTGEIVIDRGVAAQAGVRLGDTVQVLSREFKIVGLAEGTANIVNSIVFLTQADFVQLRGNTGAVSFVLVQVQPGADPAAVAGRIEATVPGVTAQSRVAFAAGERQVVRDMSTDLINIMNAVGFLIGLAVLALTIYTATFTRRAEYGVLKALGARTGHLYRTVLYQALGTVALGFALAVLLTLGLAALVPLFSANLLLVVSTESLLKVSAAALVIAGVAALLPIQQIAGLDPARVFRGGWK
jgi:putative ABC transport system permease protein